MTTRNSHVIFFFFQAEDGIRDFHVTGVQTCALPIYTAGLAPHCESMILRCDKYLSCRKIPHRMVTAAMSIRELYRLAAHCQAQQLVAAADAEDRQLPVRQRANCIDRVAYRRRISWAIRQEHASGLERSDFGRSGRSWDDGHTTSVLDEESEDVALHPEVERDDVMLRVSRSLAVRGGDRRGAREIESIHRRRCREGGADRIAGFLAQREYPAHGTLGPDVSRELPRIDVGDQRHLRAREPVEQRTGRAPVRGRRRQLANHDTDDAGAVRFDVFGIDAVIADHRRGHHDDLAEIGGVGEDLLIPAQIGGEDDFRVGRLKWERSSSGEPGAVLEEDVSGCWTTVDDCSEAAAPGGELEVPSVEFPTGAAWVPPAWGSVPGPRAPNEPACPIEIGR